MKLDDIIHKFNPFRKYDRSKIIVDGFKSNEEALTQNLQIAEDKLKQNEAKYESLKTYAKSQIEK